MLTGCTKADEVASANIDKEDSKKHAVVVLPTISSAVVERKQIAPTIHCTGQVQPIVGKECSVAPRFSGRLVKVAVTPGTHVTRGQTLAFIDSQEVSDLQAELIEEMGKERIALAHQVRERAVYEEELVRPRAFLQAQKEAEQTKVSLGLAVSDFERISALQKEKIAAAKDFRAATATLAQARLDKELAQAALEREKKLFINKATIRKDLQLAEAETEQSRQHVRMVKQRLRLLGVPQDTIESICKNHAIVSTVPVTAPITGVVVSQRVDPGEFVDAGKELFSVCDLSVVSIVSELPETELAAVHNGLSITATVDSYPNHPFAGKIFYIGSHIDSRTRTVPVRVLVPNPGGRLKINMFANVAIAGASRVAVACPRSAVHSDGDQSVVYALVKDGYERRVVTTGIDCGDQVEVVTGLSAGEKVVTEGGVLVKTELSHN